MIRGGFKRQPESYRFVYINQQIFDICKTIPLQKFIVQQQRNYVAHVIRSDNEALTKRLLFNTERSHVPGRQASILQQAIKQEEISGLEFIRRAADKRY